MNSVKKRDSKMDKVFERSILGLYIVKGILVVFFYREVIHGTNVSYIFDGLVLILCFFIAWYRYRNGQEIIKGGSLRILIYLLIGISILLIITTISHRRQVQALTDMIKKVEAKSRQAD